MASNANVGAGLNLGKFAQATELRQRIWFTLGALIIFRLLSFVPLPGIDPVALQDVVNLTQEFVETKFDDVVAQARSQSK